MRTYVHTACSMVMFGGVSINPQITCLKSRGWISWWPPPAACWTTWARRPWTCPAWEILVLDEAGPHAGHGFRIHDIKKVLALLPKQRQNLLFSATSPMRSGPWRTAC